MSKFGRVVASKAALGRPVLFIPPSRLLLTCAACLLFGATSIQAITVNYTLNGQLGAVLSGPDGLGLAGKSISITGTVDSSSNANLQVSLGSLSVSLTGVKVSFAAGNPGSISITGQALGNIPFGATIRLNLPSSSPAPFPTESIQGGSLSYGTPPTVIAIAGGTVMATSNAPSITASPGSLSFTAQAGTAPPSQQVSLSAATTVPFTAQANDSWVVVSPTSAETGAGGTLTVSLNAATMPTTPGLHTSGITITSNSAANSGFVIPVSVTITSGNTLAPSPSSLAFIFQAGGTPPAAQSVSVGSSGASQSFTASASTSSGGSWLSVTPNGATTLATLSVSVNPAGLAAGTYSGAIALTPSSGTVVRIPVGLTVTASANLTALPTSLTFTSAVGGSAPTQVVAIGSKGAATSFNASASTNSGGSWLSVTPSGGTTPMNLSVSVNPAGLAAGSYTGSVTVSPGGGATPLIVTVTLTVSATLSLSVTPTALSFNALLGTAGPGAQSLNIGGSGLAFTTVASSTSGGAWFSVSAASGTSPLALTVSVNLAGLAAGSYAGTITVTPTAGGAALTVPVTLNVAAAPALITGKSALAFAYEVGATAPASRTVPLGSSGSAVAVNASGFTNLGGAWLTASPSTVATPGSLVVSANPSGLSPGIYTGAISLSAQDASSGSSSIAVVLSVSTGTAIAAAPNVLTFTAQTGGISPAPQTVDLASTGSAINLAASAAVTSGGNWLSVSPASGSAPGSLAVSANSAGFAAGTYSGTISLAYGGASPLVIPVTLTVNPPAPTIQAVTDAASLAAGSLAPFSLFTIWGGNLGPATATPLQLGSSGIATTLASTQVLVNGIPAPLLMVSANQINAVIPGSIAVGATANVQVIHQGIKSSLFSVQITNAAPALFTAHASGTGQGAILNEDSTANSSANPAEPGSIVVIFLDGAGLTTPLQADGSITTTVFDEIPKLNLPVSVQIGGVTADVSYSGPAPGALAGLTQVNARVPASTSSGAAPVTVMVGTVASQAGVTVAVK